MKYRLLATDIDGTLINSKRELTEKTIKAIHRLQDNGVFFTLSTGRPLQNIRQFIEPLKIKAPVIIYNGAMIVDPKTEEILFDKTMDKNDARLLIDNGKEWGANILMWSKGKLYAYEYNKYIEFYHKQCTVEPIIIDNKSMEQDIIEKGITKLLWHNEVPDVQDFVNNKIPKIDIKNTTLCTSMPYFLELFNKDISKAISLGKVGEICGVSPSEIVAVGDGENDVEMLQFAGLGVAMDNASDSVKNKADEVTSSNDEDGVAVLIEKLLNNN